MQGHHPAMRTAIGFAKMWLAEAMSRPECYASRILRSPQHPENSLQSVSLRSRQCQCLSMCRLAGYLFEWNRCQILWDPYMI